MEPQMVDRLAPVVCGLLIGLLIIGAIAWVAHKADKAMEEFQTPSYGRPSDPVD